MSETSLPPVADRVDVVRELHGVRRVDAYDWLSDRIGPATMAYLTAERAFYDTATQHLRSLRNELFCEMRSPRVPD